MASSHEAKQHEDSVLFEKGEHTLKIPEDGRCNFTALRKATRRVSQLYDAVLAPCGLRSTQWSVLIHIGRAGKPTQTELADSLALDYSALAHNLKPLERDGLVEIVADKDDKRSRRVILTQTGRSKVAESLVLWERAQYSLEAIIGVQKAKALRSSLELLSSKTFSHAFGVLQSGNTAAKVPKN